LTRSPRPIGPFGLVLGVLLAAILLVLPPPVPANVFQGQIAPHYGADSSTILFDDFESTTKAESFSAGCTYVVGGGFLSGSAIRLSDTGAHATYSESWVRSDTQDGIQDSGTIECFVKVESFVITNEKFFPLVATQEARPPVPNEANWFDFGFNSDQPYFDLSDPSAGNYVGIQGDSSIHLGQWIHLAATWGPLGKRLYVNGDLVASDAADSLGVQRDTFFIGIPGRNNNNFRGISVPGLYDKLRISAGQRTRFPAALSVVIDTPGNAAGETRIQPFPVQYRAYESDTRAKTVNLYLDTDGLGFNGTLVASGLAETGTVSIGGVPADTYFIVAIAFAGSDSVSYTTEQAVIIVNNPSILSLFGSGLGGGQACVISRAEFPAIQLVRSLRDLLFGCTWTRWIVSLYYSLGV